MLDAQENNSDQNTFFKLDWQLKQQTTFALKIQHGVRLKEYLHRNPDMEKQKSLAKKELSKNVTEESTKDFGTQQLIEELGQKEKEICCDIYFQNRDSSEIYATLPVKFRYATSNIKVSLTGSGPDVFFKIHTMENCSKNIILIGFAVRTLEGLGKSTACLKISDKSAGIKVNGGKTASDKEKNEFKISGNVKEAQDFGFSISSMEVIVFGTDWVGRL